MIKQAYNVIMDPEQNPLRALPKTVRFQYMLLLSYMWSGVFALWTGLTFVFGPTLFAHTVILLAIFFTADVFRYARLQARSPRDLMRNQSDGTALYDDMWGAPSTSSR